MLGTPLPLNSHRAFRSATYWSVQHGEATQSQHETVDEVEWVWKETCPVLIGVISQKLCGRTGEINQKLQSVRRMAYSGMLRRVVQILHSINWMDSVSDR
jgi:hypothetical protein